MRETESNKFKKNYSISDFKKDLNLLQKSINSYSQLNKKSKSSENTNDINCKINKTNNSNNDTHSQNIEHTNTTLIDLDELVDTVYEEKRFPSALFTDEPVNFRVENLIVFRDLLERDLNMLELDALFPEKTEVTLLSIRILLIFISRSSKTCRQSRRPSRI